MSSLTIEDILKDREAIWEKIDEHTEKLAQQHTEDEKIKTVLVGINGTNGLKGKVEEIDHRFGIYRQAVREDMKSMGEKFSKSMETLILTIQEDKKDREKKAREFRLEIYTVLGVTIAVITFINSYLSSFAK